MCFVHLLSLAVLLSKPAKSAVSKGLVSHQPCLQLKLAIPCSLGCLCPCGCAAARPERCRGCGRTSDNRASAILAPVSYPNWENTFLHPEAFWAFLVMICCSDSICCSVCIQQQSERLDNCRQMPRRLMLQWWKRMFFLGLMWERRMERSCFPRWPWAVSVVLGLAPAHGTGGRVPREMGAQLAKKRVKRDFWAHWSIRST